MSGQYRGSDSWHFLERFCFEKGNGRLEAEFLFPANANPKLLAYFLEPEEGTEFSGWKDIYSGPYNCSEKYDLAKRTSGTVFDLKSPAYVEGVEFVDDKLMKRARIITNVFTSRSRWFFFALGNCDSKESGIIPPTASSCKNYTNPDGTSGLFCDAGVDAYWYFNFTNGEGPDMYFGSDESSVFITTVVFVVFYIALCFYTMRVRNILINIRKYHVTVKIIIVSVIAATIQVTLELVNYAQFRNSGSTSWSFKSFSTFFGWVADWTLILTLMLLMKGWTIVRRKISATGRVRIAIFLVVYGCTQIACTVYFWYGVDHALVVYVYNSWPGYVLIVLRVCLFMWMVRANAVTLRKYDAKHGFYTKFTTLACVWVLSVPILVCINYAVDEYMRFKLLYGLEYAFLFLTQSVIINMYNPNSWLFGKSFPFHATTTAMLQSRAATKGSGTNIADIHLRHATEISRRVKKGVNTLQGFSNDLMGFLEEIDPAEEDLINNDEDLPGCSSSGSLHNDVGKKGKKRSVDPRPSLASTSNNLPK